MARCRFERRQVRIADWGRRHDDGAADSSAVHRGEQLVSAERFPAVRARTGNRDEGLAALLKRPRPVGPVRFPQMDLRVDDHLPGDLVHGTV